MLLHSVPMEQASRWQCRTALLCHSARPRHAHSCRASRTFHLLIHAEQKKRDIKPLVVVGSANADVMLQVPRFAQPGETLAAKSMQTLPGGKGANQAAAAARLGHPTIFIGQVGSDANSGLVLDALRGCGVDLSHVRQVAGPTGSAVITVDPAGENIIVIVGGANMAEWEFSQEAREALQTAGMVLLQREIPEEVNTELAQSSGVPVLLDCGGGEGRVDAALLQHLTYISPNESELERATGLPTGTEQQVQEAARALQEQGVRAVLAKLGTKGSLLVKQDGSMVKQGILPAEQVVDTTGAGDCFTGAVAVGLLEGRAEQDALKFAAAAGSLCVSKEGAMPSMPQREEVDRLLSQQQ